MNTGVAWPIDSTEAWARVLRMQAKLHRWAVADPGRRFDDVFNLVYDPAFLAAAWDRVRTNTGARTAGVDQIAPRSITSARAVSMLADLRDQVKTGGFVPDRSGKSRSRKPTARCVGSGFRRWRIGWCRRR